MRIRNMLQALRLFIPTLKELRDSLQALSLLAGTRSQEKGTRTRAWEGSKAELVRSPQAKKEAPEFLVPGTLNTAHECSLRESSAHHLRQGMFPVTACGKEVSRSRALYRVGAGER